MVKKQDSTEEKKSSKLPIFAGILIFMFIISFFAYSKFKPDGFTIMPDTYYTYNNFEFRKISGLWVSEIYDTQQDVVYSLPMHYGPKELEDIDVDARIKNFINIVRQFKGPSGKSATYVTYNPDINDSQISLAYYELSQHLDTVYKIETFPTVTHDVANIENETIMNCENSTKPVIYLKYQSPAYISLNDNCLIIQGEGTDMVRAADKALYVFYGIMNSS